MSRRPLDWHLVDLDSDPVPASRSEVAAVARTMRDRADTASDMRDLLKKLSDLEGWRGQAAETFADKADDVLGDLGKVEDRYSAVADALDSWAVDVGTARTATKLALDAAVTASEDLKKHPDHPDTGELTPEQSDDITKHGEAKTALTAAKGKIQEAMDALDTAANRAKDDIEKAADIWDDGIWGNVKGWVRDHADLIDLICKILEIAAIVLAAITLVLALTIGAPFLLIALAVGAGVLLLAGHAALVLADTGKATWEDVAWDVVGLAATLVGGKAAVNALRGLKGLVPAMASRVGASTRASALSRLVGSNGPQFNNALRIANPQNNLAIWAAGLRNSAAATGQAASQAVDDLLRIAPDKVRVILAQDRSLAQMAETIKALRPLANSAETAALADIARSLKIAIGGTSVGTGIMGKDTLDLPDTISELLDNPVWSTHPAR